MKRGIKMLNQEERIYIEQYLKEYFPENMRDVDVQIHEVCKSNELKEAIIIRSEKGQPAPVFYLDRYEKNSIQETMAAIANDYLKQPELPWDSARYLEEIRPDIQKQVGIKAVQSFGNKEFLANTPHHKIHDIAFYPYCRLPNRLHFTYTYAYCKQAHVSHESLLQRGLQQLKTEYSLQKIQEEIRQLGGSTLGLQESDLYVLSNQEKLFGAAVIGNRDILQEVKEQLQDSFFILPSSIHETLLLPEKKCDFHMKELEQLVSAVNQQIVTPSERLSDRIYRYEDKKKGLEMFMEDRWFAENCQYKANAYVYKK